MRYGKGDLDSIAQYSTRVTKSKSVSIITIIIIITFIILIIIILIFISSPKRAPKPGHEVPNCFHQDPKKGSQVLQAWCKYVDDHDHDGGDEYDHRNNDDDHQNPCLVVAFPLPKYEMAPNLRQNHPSRAA